MDASHSMNNLSEPETYPTRLYAWVQDIAATLDLPTVAARLATHIRELLQADYGLVYLLAEAEPPSQLVEVVGAAADWNTTPYIGALLCFEEDPLGLALRSGVGQIITHTPEAARLLQIPDVPPDSTALLCAPLIHEGEVIGVAAVARSVPAPAFVPDDMKLLLRLITPAATAVAHAKLYQIERECAVALRQSLAQQQEHDRLKDQFLQNVSHEFRAPLTIARGYIELLELELETLSPAQQDAVTVVARRLRMLSELVRDINTILHTKNPTVQHEPLDLAELVTHTGGDFCRSAERAMLTLTIEVEMAHAWVLGNSVQLLRVVDNLIGNALKFTPPGGRIDVRLRQNGDKFQLAVADTGVGMSPENIQHIFERFYQAEGLARWYPGEQGMGLGLTMVKEIIEAHGGQVQVESDLGKGSTFTVSLPVMQAAS